MNNLLISKNSIRQIELAKKRPSHAYLFVGKEGLGKLYAAENFAKSLLGADATNGDLSRWIMIANPEEGKKISFEQMKTVRKFCNSSVSTKLQNKAVIINRAEAMSAEAYNSLLLLLEEPPIKTVVILITESTDPIPKTILSRLQTINFFRPEADQIIKAIESNNINSELADYFYKCPSNINIYLSDKSNFELLYSKAKRFINGGLTERLMVSSSIGDKHEASLFLQITANLMDIKNNNDNWLGNSQSLISAQYSLYNNINTKLLMEKLSLEFK